MTESEHQRLRIEEKRSSAVAASLICSCGDGTRHYQGGSGVDEAFWNQLASPVNRVISGWLWEVFHEWLSED